MEWDMQMEFFHNKFYVEVFIFWCLVYASAISTLKKTNLLTMQQHGATDQLLSFFFFNLLVKL